MRGSTPGLMPLPPSLVAKRAELERVERVGQACTSPRARRLFAIERRRLIIAIDLETRSEIAAA